MLAESEQQQAAAGSWFEDTLRDRLLAEVNAMKSERDRCVTVSLE